MGDERGETGEQIALALLGIAGFELIVVVGRHHSRIEGIMSARVLPRSVVPAKAGTHIPEAGVYGSPQRGPRDASVAGRPSRGRQPSEFVSPVRITASACGA